MNVAAHQEKEKNEKTGKRKVGEERRQADFKRCVLPFCGRSGGFTAKNGLCEGSARV